MSKRINVLIKSSDLLRVFKNNYSAENLQLYTTYLLQPYIQLKYFSFCDYINTGETIDGSVNPDSLILEIKNIYNKQCSIVECLYQTHASDFFQSELLKVLSGRFNTHTFFYNSVNDSTFLDETTYNSIERNPELYILSKVNINK